MGPFQSPYFSSLKQGLYALREGEKRKQKHGAIERGSKQKQKMLFLRGGGGSGGAAGAAAAAGMNLVRYFSRKCAPDLRRINPKVPREEAKEISQGLYQIIKERGPLSVANTWNHAKEAGIPGLSSKTHMKIMLKWMRGRKMLKLFCTHHGSAKRFLHSTLPEDPRPVQEETVVQTAASDSLQPSMRQEKKRLKKLNKKQKRTMKANA